MNSIIEKEKKLNQTLEKLKNLDFAINIHPFIGIKNLRPILMDLIEKSEI